MKFSSQGHFKDGTFFCYRAYVRRISASRDGPGSRVSFAQCFRAETTATQVGSVPAKTEIFFS